MATVLAGVGEALQTVSSHPRARNDRAAAGILREMLASESLEDLMDCTLRLEERLGARRGGPKASADRRRKPLARTFIRL